MTPPDAAVDLAEVGDAVEWGDPIAAGRARTARRAEDGRLGELAEWLAETRAGWPVAPLQRPRCLVLGPVRARVVAAAADLDAGLRSIEVDADVDAALAQGVRIADDEVDSGAELVIVADPSTDAAAASLVGVLTDAEPVALLPRGARATDTTAWIDRAEQLRDARRRLVPLAGRPHELLTAIGSPCLALAVGLVLRLAARRTPVVLDGTSAVAAALLATRVQPRTARWVILADRGSDPAHGRAREAMGRATVSDLGTSCGDGLAGLLALPVLRAAAYEREP